MLVIMGPMSAIVLGGECVGPKTLGGWEGASGHAVRDRSSQRFTSKLDVRPQLLGEANYLDRTFRACLYGETCAELPQLGCFVPPLGHNRVSPQV